jgi:acyl-CoA thioester hydrolase
MPAIFEHHHTILASEIDGNGHANNVAYVAWMQEAAVAHSTAQGWPPDRYASAGVAWIARSHAVEYLAEAFLGDRIVIRTWVADMRKITSRRRYRIERDDGGLLATAETNWVFIGSERRQPKRIPPEVAEAFEIVEQ